MNERMMVLRVLPALFCMVALGGGLVWLLWRGADRPKFSEWFGWSWILGSGGLSLLLALFGLVCSGTPLILTTASVCIGIAVAGFLKQRRMVGGFWWAPNTPTWEKLLAVGVGAFVLLAGWRMLTYPLIWDGILIWEHKARAAYVNGGALPGWFFQDENRLWTHPSYPLGLPLMMSWVYLWVGEWNQEAVIWLFPCFLAAGVSLLGGLVAKGSGRGWMGALSAVALLCIPDLAFGKCIVGTGYADFPLGVAYLGALGALLVTGVAEKRQWPLAGACGAVCVWLKAEGLFFWLTLALIALFVGGRRNLRHVLIACLPGLVVFVTWKAVLWGLSVPQAATFQEVSPVTLVHNVTRLGAILEYMAGLLFLVKDFSLTWWLVVAALIQLWTRRSAAALPMTLAILFPLGLYVGPYLFTSLDLEWHLKTSCSRLFLQLIPAALFIVGFVGGRPTGSVAGEFEKA